MSEMTIELPIDSADWAFARIPRGRRDVVLDLSGGRDGRRLSADVRAVIALHPDPAWLERMRSAGTAAGVENVTYLRGDPASLPFLDASFRVVLCGFALHAFPRPQVQLREIKRVLEPHGWLGLADMVVSEDPAVAERQNAIEALRDPSHVRALSASELQDSLVRLGYEVAGAETHELRQPFEGWLTSSPTPQRAVDGIRARLEAEGAGGPPTGLAPQFGDDGVLSVAHTVTSLLVLNRDG